uniref:Uncharacterized protein n=1 Tax=Ficus carica TaxID=3494 RepID=A0AA88D0F1_FICCA|nr:hypothetical protein TIFTF001_045774 [Ficus carica]
MRRKRRIQVVMEGGDVGVGVGETTCRLTEVVEVVVMGGRWRWGEEGGEGRWG